VMPTAHMKHRAQIHTTANQFQPVHSPVCDSKRLLQLSHRHLHAGELQQSLQQLDVVLFAAMHAITTKTSVQLKVCPKRLK
jgi:hypothetical protein